ncbi:MAG: RecQ family ATP-dependent DNA helicase [Candidatus Velthaea sp.]
MIPRSREDFRALALFALRQGTGDPLVSFRDDQLEAIEALGYDRKRLLLVQRTGWGKSIVYFATTKILRADGSGPVLIVSPLLALMRNQLDTAARMGLRAERLDSDNQHIDGEWERIYGALEDDAVDVLLVSPERLANASFRERAQEKLFGRLGMLVVDEAHCISDWGHDFRPHYRLITQFVRFLAPNVPMLATTATADERVVEDVRAQLGGIDVVRGPLGRDSLRLDVISGLSYAGRLAWLSRALSENELSGSGIIYTLTTRDANLVSEWLRSRGINVRPYHGNIDNAVRAAREQLLLSNDVKALVATSALGMGYDKGDLGFVVHFQSTQSVVHYYQMVGRAGRAIQTAYGVLLTGSEDDEIFDYFVRNAVPSQQLIEMILQAVTANPQSSLMLMAAVNVPKFQVNRALEFLALETPSPIVKIDAKWSRTAIAYAYPAERVKALATRRAEERALMSTYLRGESCLMQFLGRSLGDASTGECGRCGVCIGKALIDVGDIDKETEVAEDFINHREIMITIRKQWPIGGLPRYGFASGRTISASLRAEPGRALAYFQLGRNGRRLRAEKYELRPPRFSEMTVSEAATLIRTWDPQPSPQWIVPMPSLNRPDLVPDFAERLGEELGLPVHRALHKLFATEEQKKMENSSFQARNLDGSLEVKPFKAMERPGLFVDDMCDSGWTVAVAVALLRGAGSGIVFPFTLSKASGRE